MSPTALIVDDSLTVRMDLTEAFEAAGFTTTPCATAGEARAAFARGGVDVVVLDVVLPDGDGITLLGELRATAGLPPIVLMLSSEADVRDRIRGLREGADDYVGKPYDRGYVVARAQELLRARRAASAGPPLVLVIDDSVTFRSALAARLETAGYAVVVAGSGEEGLRIAADRRPAAMIVDGQLPGIDGAAVIRRVRLDGALRAAACLLLTGSEEREAELRALDAGADAFVRKDEDLDVVLARLSAALRRASTAPAGTETSSLLGPKKILAVDDSMTYLHQLGDDLRGEGYDVILASSGEEALELLAVESVDCILLDVVMPGLGGTETCRRIKTSSVAQDIPLIMLTAYENRSSMIEGLGSGADDFISKSSDFEVVKARVRAQLRRKQLEDEHRRIREELLRRELEAAEARAARQLAETRAAYVEELERKNQELEAFSYTVSHDLRNPLSGIVGFTQLLLEDHARQLDAHGLSYLNQIASAAHQMQELIEALLQLSRITSAELQCQTVDLSAVARAIGDDLARRDPARQVTFTVAPGLVVDADRRLLRAVLDNLIGNAWKFTARTRQATITVGCVRRKGEVVYFVRDNGAGFDSAQAARLFRPFQRLHRASDFSGTGIGLATVRRIIERHSGRVWAEGEVGQGATMYFTLRCGAVEQVA